MVTRSLQVNQSPAGPASDPKLEVGKGQDQIHYWLAVYGGKARYNKVQVEEIP